MISSSTPWATPTTCSAAQVFSPACSLNLEAGALQTGQNSGGVSPSWT